MRDEFEPLDAVLTWTFEDIYHAKIREADELRQENTRLRVTIQTLNRRLRQARERQENWLLRQAEWRLERERLRRLQ